ncbi:hypothetical protein N7931_17475 [Catenovulum sp. 2E275]|uniref:hypothetical protein n=1 Tax=Catenovulum sp. 2E275 TaxID=2980497 RepID=UPI0021D18DBF|nr:hypothetical protein [Catenovulum sp. 2E275]MCU4677417.1 hypothetical protein [Catenovulum sp. 2E275]
MLLYWLYPEHSANQPSIKPADNQSVNALPETSLPEPEINNQQPEAEIKAVDNTQPIALDINPQVKDIEPVEASLGVLADLLAEQDYQTLNDQQKLALLLAIDQCLEFSQFVKQNTMQIPASEIEAADPVKLQKINNCQALPAQALVDLNQQAEQLALNAQSAELKIQAAMLLSHLPSIRRSQDAPPEDPYVHYQKQLMWLEHARAQGSLEALLSLAMRYQYGEAPDPVTATSYYFALEQLAPQYQLAEQVKSLTENLKTWQLEQAKQSSQLYIKEMRSLDNLYSW